MLIMRPLLFITDLHCDLVDRDTRRARLLAARRKMVGSINRKGILSGHWDAGIVVGTYCGGKGTFMER